MTINFAFLNYFSLYIFCNLNMISNPNPNIMSINCFFAVFYLIKLATFTDDLDTWYMF